MKTETKAIRSRLKDLNLPIVAVIEELCENFRNHQNTILEAEPGAGKTSIVPLYLLDEIPPEKKILLLQPRRLAARSAAERLAELLNEPVGETVGFRIRNESKISKKTRIEVITEGILIRMLQSDPELTDIGLIIFDEFHERSLESDLGLAFSVEIQQTLREDLKLLVMSATLDSEKLSSLLDGAPCIASEGRSFKVDTTYMPPSKNSDWLSVLVPAVKSVLSSNLKAKDILIFLPGIKEINSAKILLTPLVESTPELSLLSLYGDLSFSQQRQVFIPMAGRRKIILSTNIAETSITIDGVGAVIDIGLMRQSYFDPNVGFNRLRTAKISKASAIQRTGRAGRTAAGICIRLWSESENLRAQSQPDILREDLTLFALELAMWGIIDPQTIKLSDQPSGGILAQARQLLESIDAIDSRLKITAHGRKIARLGVHPRIAQMLLKSIPLGCSELACTLAAMLDEKDLFVGEQRNNPDFMARLNFIVSNSKSNRSVQKITTQANKLIRKLRELPDFDNSTQKRISQSIEMAASLLAMAFPDRIAQTRGTGYRLSNGTGASSYEPLIGHNEFLVAVKLGGQAQTPKIFQFVLIDRSELDNLFQSQMVEHENIVWDEQSQSVKATVESRLGSLILSSKMLSNPSKALVAQGLAQGIRKLGLPWTPELRQLQARVTLLRRQPGMLAEFNEFSDESLSRNIENWLAPFIQGFRKLNQVTSKILEEALVAQMDWQSQQRLNDLMPTHIKVASGSKIKVDYCHGDKPVLAVKLQEMFGERQSPIIASGNLPLVIHLLSPARKPLAITEDLESFWANAYNQVKKEMKGRYPRHPWPDDPISAEATRYTKARIAKNLKNN